MRRVNEADLEWSETEREETGFRRKKLAAAAGADDLGASLYELPPGTEDDRDVSGYYRRDDDVDYWTDEE